MELSKLSLGELKRLKSRIETEISRRTDTTKRDLLKKFQKMTAELGLSINDVIGKPAAAEGPRAKRGTAKKATAAKTKVAPKYRNPGDAAQTWTGRGRKPQWVSQQLEQGKTLDDLLIK